MKFLDDSAWFCVEELKKHCFSMKKNVIFDKKLTWIRKIRENIFFELLDTKPCRIIRNFIKNSVLDPKRVKFTKTLVSGIWFLSPEARGTLSQDPEEPWRPAGSQSL